MTEKRYYTVDYDEQYYIFDSNVIRKGRVEEEAEYSYDVFANSMSSTEIIDKLNELTNENEQLKQSFDKSLLNHTKTCDEYRILSKKNKRLKEENKQLKEKNATIKGRIINAIVKSNQVECNCSPCICEDYVNEELKKW